MSYLLIVSRDIAKITLQYPNGEVKCTKIAIEFNFQKDGVVSKVQHTRHQGTR